MAKRELQTQPAQLDERDESQRSLGFIGLSALAHVGLLIAVLLAPSFRTQQGESTGHQAGVEFQGEASGAPVAAVADGAATDAGASSNGEVLLAKNDGTSAAELPAEQTVATPEAAAQPSPKAAAVKPVEAKATTPKKASSKSVATAAPIADALKAARTESVKSKSENVAAPKLKDDIEIAATESNSTAPVEATASAETTEITEPTEPSETTETKTQEPPAQTDDETPTPAAPAQVVKNEAPAAEAKSDEAVPLQIALPESEALTQEQEEALQAKPIPSNATPIETVQSVHSDTKDNQPMLSSGHLSGASSSGNNSSNNPTGGSAGNAPTANGQPAVGTFRSGFSGGLGASSHAAPGAGSSQGANSGAGVPAGVPVRDANSLTALQGNPRPVYPLADKMAGRQGTAVLVGKISNAGLVESVTLEKSSGSKLMDDSAAQAFKSWKYKPGQEGYVRLPVQFQLVGDTKTIPAQLQRQ